MSFQQLIHQLGESNKKLLKSVYFKRMNDAYSGEGLVLSCLQQYGGQATPAEVSRELGVSTARVAALLNKMEGKNLVERQRHPDNKKNTIVRILPEGEKVYRIHKQEFQMLISEFFETLGEERAKVFVELQEEMADFMEKEQKRIGGKDDGSGS